jgi:hypothetical protein
LSFLFAAGVLLSAERADPETVDKTRTNKGEIVQKKNSDGFIFDGNAFDSCDATAGTYLVNTLLRQYPTPSLSYFVNITGTGWS